jgi:hypothetical protein
MRIGLAIFFFFFFLSIMIMQVYTIGNNLSALAGPTISMPGCSYSVDKTLFIYDVLLV